MAIFRHSILIGIAMLVLNTYIVVIIMRNGPGCSNRSSSSSSSHTSRSNDRIIASHMQIGAWEKEKAALLGAKVLLQKQVVELGDRVAALTLRRQEDSEPDNVIALDDEDMEEYDDDGVGIGSNVRVDYKNRHVIPHHLKGANTMNRDGDDLELNRNPLVAPLQQKRFPMTPLQKMCENTLGYGFVNHLRDVANIVCHPAASTVDAISSVRCRHLTMEAMASDYTLCDVENLYIDFTRIQHVPSRLKTNYLRVLADAVGGRCLPDKVMNTDTDYFQYHVKEVLGNFVEVDWPCEQWVEEPTLIVGRYEHSNLYYAINDYFNSFIALETLDWKSIRVLLFDEHVKSRLDGPWKDVFAPRYKTSRWSFYTGRICFRRAAFVVPGYQSPISLGRHEPSLCQNSDLLIAFSRFFLNAYKLMDIKRPSDASIVTFVFRSSHENGGRLHNLISNEDELVALGRSIPGIHVVVAYMGALPMKEQLRIIRETSILIGMHGAGLTHTIFLPDDAILLEIFPSHVQDRHHFRNLARLSGHPYFFYRNEVDTDINDFETYIDIEEFRTVFNAAILLMRNSDIRS